MPEIKHYEKKKHQAKKHTQKRRPYHDVEGTMTEAEETTIEAAETTGEAETMTAEADAINTEAQNEGVNAAASEVIEEERMASEGGPVGETTIDPKHEEKSKIHLNFYGSELIRQKAPKVMDLADTVAEEWVHDGKFEGLPVGNPIAQMAAAKALRTAKDVEKKLDEKGVFAMAKMGVEYVKSKIEKKNK